MSFLEIVFFIAMAFVALLFVFLFINVFSSSTWFCTFWGWHKAPKHQTNDGVNQKGTCSRCGEKVMQDSQGNWF